jgi:hypothetical protein
MEKREEVRSDMMLSPVNRQIHKAIMWKKDRAKYVFFMKRKSRRSRKEKTSCEGVQRYTMNEND